MIDDAKYSFTYHGKTYYVTNEASGFVTGYKNGGEPFAMKKENLKTRFFNGLVDFGKETSPDFLDDKVKA